MASTASPPEESSGPARGGAPVGPGPAREDGLPTLTIALLGSPPLADDLAMPRFRQHRRPVSMNGRRRRRSCSRRRPRSHLRSRRRAVSPGSRSCPRPPQALSALPSLLRQSESHGPAGGTDHLELGPARHSGRALSTPSGVSGSGLPTRKPKLETRCNARRSSRDGTGIYLGASVRSLPEARQQRFPVARRGYERALAG